MTVGNKTTVPLSFFFFIMSFVWRLKATVRIIGQPHTVDKNNCDDSFKGTIITIQQNNDQARPWSSSSSPFYQNFPSQSHKVMPLFLLGVFHYLSIIFHNLGLFFFFYLSPFIWYQKVLNISKVFVIYFFIYLF